MKIRWIRLLAALLTGCLLFSSCSLQERSNINISVSESGGFAEDWEFGFGAQRIIAPSHADGKGLYISGYHTGWYATQYLDLNKLDVYQKMYGERTEENPDYAQARAVWMDAGSGGMLLIGIDCIALSSETVGEIRERLKELCSEHHCLSINVYATHVHAQPDTLGLWGPVGMDGKNEEYMKALVKAAVEAAEEAVGNIRQGELRYGKVKTENMLYDSRYPHIYDDELHQLRFVPEEGNGVRIFLYGAHAEALRGENRMLSRDFPGVLCDVVEYKTGDSTMFLPGAIGGLIMTDELPGILAAAENMEKTGILLADYAMSILPETEQVVSPMLKMGRGEFTIPLDNGAFLLYKTLGILEAQAVRAKSDTGYGIRTEMNILQLGNLAVALIPGEIFPELVFGGEYGSAGDGENPVPLCETAEKYGYAKLLIAGLANDEIGYIVPPSDFLLNEVQPYFDTTMDSVGENHYEETNSVGKDCAWVITYAFEEILKAMAK